MHAIRLPARNPRKSNVVGVTYKASASSIPKHDVHFVVYFFYSSQGREMITRGTRESI